MRVIGSLFSGVGGLELGLEWAGLGPVAWQVEIDRELREDVLARWWPLADRSVSDVREAGRELEPVRIVCGGFPCQDVSVAGLGRGLDGERSGLWRHFARVVGELLPRWVVVENVASGKARWLCQVRSDLQALGYRSSAVALSAADVGAPHRRGRIFVLGLAAGSRLEWENEARTERDASRSGVANPNHNRREGLATNGFVAGFAHGGDADGCGSVAHTHGGELRDAEQRDPGRRARAVRDGRSAEPRNDRALGGWRAESGLGRGADGVPPRVDGWPSRRGAPQAADEPPRVVRHGRGGARRERLAALGNAVVPQCAEVVGRMIRAVDAGESWEAVFDAR